MDARRPPRSAWEARLRDATGQAIERLPDPAMRRALWHVLLHAPAAVHVGYTDEGRVQVVLGHGLVLVTVSAADLDAPLD